MGGGGFGTGAARQQIFQAARNRQAPPIERKLAGVDLLYLKPVASRFGLRLVLREEGTADYQFTTPNPPTVLPQPTPPFPIRWELSDERILSIWLPIAPMPKYDMPDWSREQICYDVFSVADL